MSTHVFGAIATHHGIAANNRGDSQGANITPLQKILWHGESHTTVSAEAIRFALRRSLAAVEPEGTNRYWAELPDDVDPRCRDLYEGEMKKGKKGKPLNRNYWKDFEFAAWLKGEGHLYIDDDLLGFMNTEAGKEEAEDSGTGDETGGGARTRKARGMAVTRRAVLEVTRAVSLTPWEGDVCFNAASIGATPGAAKKGQDPVPYGTEMHATRYQYGFALTPERLKKPARAKAAIERLCALGTVAGNHGRFLFDFSPESIVIRITDDPAPRLLYIFEPADGDTVDAPRLLARAQAGDIKAHELIIGGGFASTPTAAELKRLGASVEAGVRKAADLAVAKLEG